METFVPNTPNLHYFFRNRITQLYSIMKEKKIEGLLLITSYDCSYSKLMEKFVKWLLFGASSNYEIEQLSIPYEFNETFIIITLQRIFIFSLPSTGNFFNEICSKLNNVELFIVSKEDEELSENLEILKISKFVQWTQPIKKFGIPLDYNQRQNIILLDKWPLLTATALDCLKLGFFTMNHDIIDISKDLELLYHRIDTNAALNLINPKTNMLENILVDFCNYFNREVVNKKLNRSEENLNENQNLEFIRLNFEKEKKTTYLFLENLPTPRVLYGVHSNINFNEGCSTDALYKTTYDFKFPAFHMTYENFDPITGVRIGRTLILYDLQKTYLDLNDENFQYEFINSKAYNEVFYFFNLYYILVHFSRQYQFDLILGKIQINKAKEKLVKEFNDYIKKYEKENNIKHNDDFLLKNDNILINIEQYIILDKIDQKNPKDNKTIVLRFEVKSILSPYTHRLIGSLLFCDTFLYCYCELFNLTSDIIPFKFIQTTTQHFKEDPNYNSQQILVSITNIKIKDIDYRALSFYKDEYNIPYMFPDSHEVDLDHNQMFIYYQGRMNFYEDYMTFSDNSIGNIILSYKNINSFSYIEELQYTIFLFKFEDTNQLPLSGILKDELIVYLRGNTERMRDYGRTVIEFMRNNQLMRGKVTSMSKEKLFEYEIVINTFHENEYEDLSYISNSFNLTNISDIINEMFEYEFLKFNNENKNITYNDYRKIKNEISEEIQSLNSKDNSQNKNENKSKIMFVFGPDPRTVNNIKDKLVDFANKCGFSSNIIFPTYSLFNFEKNKNYENIIKQYYINEIKKIKPVKREINMVFIYHSCNVLTFIYDMTLGVSNFHKNFDILNCTYAINYDFYKSGKGRNIVNKDYYYDDIINYIFIDEGILIQEKITKFNKIVSMSNPLSKVFNNRSFYLNDKEVKKIFEDILITQKLLKFYFDYYKNNLCSKAFYQNIFIPFEYMVKEEIFNKFLIRGLNNPLQYLFNNNFKEFPKDEEERPQLNDDNAYQDYLERIVSKAKVSETDPVFIEIFGYVLFINEKNKNSNNENNNINEREVNNVTCNYKERIINLVKDFDYLEEKSEIGLFVLGKNLYFNKNYDFYKNMLRTLSGEFPQLKSYKKKEDITLEERKNLNFANLTRPLPKGWELAGPVVVDENDVIHEEHPYLDKFIEEYINVNNSAIDEYNEGIKNDINKLLI